ncbi:hypothetical protein [Lichenicoccus sp.]|uniref:hypothetical protein n=1 Tax=Lichenicoccus sp. TaxID=2781899 RepID=UPI003D13FAAC
MKAERAPNARTIMVVLFAANVLNIYDRTIPGIINEPGLLPEFRTTDYVTDWPLDGGGNAQVEIYG